MTLMFTAITMAMGKGIPVESISMAAEGMATAASKRLEEIHAASWAAEHLWGKSCGKGKAAGFFVKS